MTIAIAWVRRIRDCEELVFVSDSRLSGDGRTFDGCPKILTLPRSDCAISFAGYTGHAFPMMLQLALAIDSFEPSKRGSLDIATVRTHAIKVFDGMAQQIKSSTRINIEQDTSPAATFLFGGYSWINKEFQLWSFSFRAGGKSFVADPSNWVAYSKEANRVIYRKSRRTRTDQYLGEIAFAGDQAELAKQLLLDKLNQRAENQKPLDMEPFEVIRDMLRDPRHSETIGGSPQVVKVYQYMKTASLGVYWPDRATGSVHLQGRACLGYEQVSPFILDPDTLISEAQPPIKAPDTVIDTKTEE